MYEIERLLARLRSNMGSTRLELLSVKKLLWISYPELSFFDVSDRRAWNMLHYFNK